MISDGGKLSRDESLLGIILITASCAFGRLLSYFNQMMFFPPADIDGFFGGNFKPVMFFALSGVEVGTNERVVDS